MGHLQGQIKDLERYITFLQTKQTRLQPRARSYEGSDFTESSSTDNSEDDDDDDDDDDDEPYTAYSLKRNKHVTFSEEVSIQRCPERADYELPVPEYEVSMSKQLDGVNCALDYSRCEWEKTDTLNHTYQGPKQVKGGQAAWVDWGKN